MRQPAGFVMAARWAVAVLTASLVLGYAPAAATAPAEPSATVDPAVRDQVAGGDATFWVLLREQADLSAAATQDWNARGQFVYDRLRATAESSQAPLRALLTSGSATYEAFWIVNALKVTAGAAVLDELAARPEVAEIRADVSYQIPDPIPGLDEPGLQTVEWNIDRINAPRVWSTFGDRGEGITVASIDTGVQYNHPALVNQYRGRKADGTFDHNYNWFDPSKVCGNPSLAPCDNNNHGTHTMGTMVGDDGNPGTNQIGVAPHAKWVAAKGCESSSCSLDALLKSGQWVIAPTDLNGQNPRPDLRPQAVNNSWGGGGGSADPFYRATVQAWVAAGIFPAFANGNGGSGCNSAAPPGNYPESYGVGAFDINNNIASFSARGPSPFGGTIKPNLAAPGVNVRSSVPGGGYANFSGTSMATPHVAATIALIWAVAPVLVGDIAATRTLLDATATSVSDLQCGGTAANNNVWGRGRLDAFKAVDQAPRGKTGTLAGTVTDAGSSAPLTGASVKVTGPLARDFITPADGKYRALLTVGTYTVAVSAFGYLSQTATVVINEGQVTTNDVALAVAPRFAVSGSVRDPDGNGIADSAVTILATPLTPTKTDADGAYRFASVPAGTYEVQAKAPSTDLCKADLTQALTVAGDVTLDFSLPQRSDAYGYFCLGAPFSFIDASTVLSLTGFAQSAAVTLPFPFTLYGRTYDTAHVSTSGFLNFLAPNGNPSHVHIPDPNPPNAAIYPFWEALVVDGQASVRTELVGTAPTRQFVIEWRNLTFSGDASRVTFEVVLFETGRVLMQYKTMAGTPRAQGASATVGIEDHDGKVALEYSFNVPGLRSSMALVYRVPPSAYVQGHLTDANDAEPVAGGSVRAVQGGAAVASTTSDKNGFYRLQLRLGSYTIEPAITNYQGDPVDVGLNTEDAFLAQDFSLRTGRADVSPNKFEFIVPADQKRTRTITLNNTGSADLAFEIKEAGGGRVTTTSTEGLALNPNYDPNGVTTEGLYTQATPPGWSITAPGNVLKSWAPGLTRIAWGVGYTGNVWISDVPGVNRNHEFTVDGVKTGRNWATPWAGEWGGDMAYDAGRGLMCQVAVGADNGIHCWNPNTGVVAGSITSGPWTSISQRGLAYRQDDDTFYIGGWNQGILYHIKGLSYADKGAVIGQCKPPDGAISGLAYNPAFDIIWEATNTPTDTIYQLNPATCNVLGTLPHPASGGFNGAGLEMDEAGNLWLLSQGTRTGQNKAYLIDSGVPAFNKVPWIDETPSSGSVTPEGAQTIELTLDTTGLQPGVYNAILFVLVNAGRQSQIRIPISLIVPAYRQGTHAAAAEYVDTLDDPWAADQQWTEGSWGFLDAGTVISTAAGIARTEDPDLYRTGRENPVAYRFEGLPSGTYQVELRFAELDESVGFNDRLFDVMIDRSVVLPAYDIFFEGGSLTAVNETFFVPVTRGRLDIRFLTRFGSPRDPLVNAVRVTHRPDR